MSGTDDTTIYCANTSCPNEATKYYNTDKGGVFYLCTLCGDAFELGQVNDDKSIFTIEKEVDHEHGKSASPVR